MKIDSTLKPQEMMLKVVQEAFPDKEIKEHFGIMIVDIDFRYLEQWNRQGLIGIQMRTIGADYKNKTIMRQVRVKGGEIDIEALKVKFAELKRIKEEGERVRAEESAHQTKCQIEELKLEREAEIRLPHRIIAWTPDSFNLTLRNLTREKVLKVMAVLRKEGGTDGK